MNFILYSDVNERSISQSLGRPEYSYYFVLKAYRPVLESLGRVHMVDAISEVDPLFDASPPRVKKACSFRSHRHTRRLPT